MASYGYLSHIVTRTDMGKNNDTMNIELKIIGPCVAPCIFISIISECIFKFLWFVKSLELFWLVTSIKFSFPIFLRNYNKCGHGHLDKMQSLSFLQLTCAHSNVIVGHR